MPDFIKGYKTIGTMPCGCEILKHPDLRMNAFIEFCPKHNAAPDMYETLKHILVLDNNYNHSSGQEYFRAGVVKLVNDTLAKAERL